MSTNGCKILLVDDDTDSRVLMKDVLETEGYFTVAAENGAVAIAQLEGGLDPDLILTDLVMPTLSGWDLCEALKRTPAWRSIPVVVMCGMAAEQRGKLQIDDAFERPLEVPKLLARIAELCGV